MSDLKIDQNTIVALAKALNFICGGEHPVTVAMRRAAETAAAADVKKARAAFLKLKPGERQAALAMIAG